MSETIAEGCDTETFEFRFGPSYGMKAVSHTIETAEPPFEHIKELCSDKPLSFNRSSYSQDLEDKADTNEALESLQEPGSIGLDEFKKQLGM